MTTILNNFMGYQDFLNPDQLIQLNNNSQSFGDKKFIFLLSKNTLSMFLPNNGKIFGYSLFNNSMNFIYNYTLREDHDLPLKLNHSLVYDNGNTVIDSKSFKNFFYKNQVISTKVTILEDLNTTDTSSISSNDSSFSSSSNMIDNEEKIIKFNDIQIKVKNNIITEINGKVFNRPIITDEDLKFYFDHGHNKKKIKTYILSFFYYLNTENSYKIYKKSFFLLSENFREEFKILITFFDHEKFILDHKIINWFIQNKIENEKNLLVQKINDLEINNKKEIFESSHTEKYYSDYNIASRMMVINSDPKGDLSIFYESLDKYHLLNQLEAIFTNTIQKDEDK